MPVENVIYNPINRAGLDCGDSFSEQKVVFGGLNCEGIKIIKGAETKVVLPMNFTIPSTSYIRNELILPKLQNVNDKIPLNCAGYTFMALNITYDKNAPDSAKLIRAGFTEDFNNSIFFPIHKTFMINAPNSQPFTEFYMFNPSNYNVTINYLISK